MLDLNLLNERADRLNSKNNSKYRRKAYLVVACSNIIESAFKHILILVGIQMQGSCLLEKDYMWIQ